jgi:hypothetical protein
MRSPYLTTALVYLFIPRSLPSNGPARYNIKVNHKETIFVNVTDSTEDMVCVMSVMNGNSDVVQEFRK